MLRLFVFQLVVSCQLLQVFGAASVLSNVTTLAWDHANKTMYVAADAAAGDQHCFKFTSDDKANVEIEAAVTNSKVYVVTSENKLSLLASTATEEGTHSIAQFLITSAKSAATKYLFVVKGVKYVQNAGTFGLTAIETNCAGTAGSAVSVKADPDTNNCTVTNAYTCEEDTAKTIGCADDERLTFQFKFKAKLVADSLVSFYFVPKFDSTAETKAVASTSFYTYLDTTTNKTVEDAIASSSASATGAGVKFANTNVFVASTGHKLTADLAADATMWFSLKGFDAEVGAQISCFSGTTILPSNMKSLVQAPKVVSGANRTMSTFAAVSAFFASLFVL